MERAKAKPKPKPKSRSTPASNASVLTQKSSSSLELLSVDFEIRGKVQGVHFRKFTQSKAKSFGLKGWVQNTDYGTVIGCMEGPRLKIDMMKDWLRRVGSPKSQITASEFKHLKTLTEHTYEDFLIIK